MVAADTAMVLCLEGGVDFRAVEADDNLTVNVNDGYAGLAGFGDGFVGVLGIGLDVFFFVLDTQFSKVVFGGMAKGAPVGAIDGDVRSLHKISVAYHYTL